MNKVSERLHRQMEFLIEADKLKTVLRQTYTNRGERRENDAEHSWHLALMAVFLQEYANDPDIDVSRVIRMLLIHDLVEIDAGDTFAYDDKGHEDKQEREEKAAARIFNLLPEDQSRVLFDLWHEFERRETAEARFAAALDRLQPMLLNYESRGAAWKKHGIASDRVTARNRHIAAGSEALWDYAEEIIRRAVEDGYLDKGEER